METNKKNLILKTLATLLVENCENILNCNHSDISLLKHEDSTISQRLKLTSKNIETMAYSLLSVSLEDDPEGVTLYKYTKESGMRIENRSVPFGTILIIYESRPNVTIEAAAIAFKAGNKVLLKGGREAKNTNMFLTELWQKALKINNEDISSVRYLNIDRNKMMELIKGEDEKIDLIVPRGGEGLIDFVKTNARVPYLISGRGNNFLFIHRLAHIDMAVSIILNGKSKQGVCNALDKVLIDCEYKDLKSVISLLVYTLNYSGIEVLGSKRAGGLCNKITIVESEEILIEEFLSAKIYLEIVDGTDQAVDLINKYSGGHSASIITSDSVIADRFMEEVDCAAVYHNASTRFTDGGEFGLGAEVAISTQKLHCRGPMGVSQLVTNKWYVFGNGDVRN
jgi:glutamate-5-semialdehyde dehydrogenase